MKVVEKISPTVTEEKAMPPVTQEEGPVGTAQKMIVEEVPTE